MSDLEYREPAASEADSTGQVYPKPGSQWPVPKVIATLLAVVLVFGAGVLVGRGDLSVRGLSSVSSNKNLPGQLDYSSVDQIYSLLKNNFDGTLDKGKLVNGIKSGLINASGDPYTEYFNPVEAKLFNDELNGSFTGIGAELGTDDQGNIIIISPLAGYPAEKAGLKSKDIIAAINGVSTNGVSVDAAVNKIRGPAGSKVTLTVVRGSGSPIDVAITRTKIDIASVQWHVDGTIGYIKISQFGNDTVKLADQAAADFKNKGVKAVVLDLRGDPGGYLSGAVDVSSLWLPQGKVVVSERRGNVVQATERANGGSPFKGLPTVVLIDNGSASASEITAGALHDNGAATLVGAKSFGKGSVQQVINLNDGSELKVTTAHWYTPNGKNIDKQGIQPDVQVQNSDADVKAGKDPQKDKAYRILQTKISG